MTTPGVDKFEAPNDVQISGDLNNTKKLEVSELLMEFQDVFTDKPGLTNLITHEIKTTTETPVHLKPYPLPYAMENIVSDEIDKMLKKDVIEPYESSFSSPIVMVHKKDETLKLFFFESFE